MRAPEYLKEGDTIGIVATARKVTEKDIQPCKYILESWGYKTVCGKNLFKTHNQFAGSDEERAADLQYMLNDDTVRAVICARGGYGTARIIDRLDFTAFCKSPKWIIGYSDITVLHSHIHTNHQIQTLHSPMAINFSEDVKGVAILRKALCGEEVSYTFAATNQNKEGVAEGMLVGGNLSLLYSLQGTASAINTKGKILFIEDLDEYLYHLDRMMVNLKRSGVLSGLAGLIVGGMTKMKDNEIPYGKTAGDIIAEAVASYHYPVCFNFEAGHLKGNSPLYFGRQAKLKVAASDCVLSFVKRNG